MNQQIQAQPATNKRSQPSATENYPELSDAELDVICGGNLIGRKR
jgi:hypothetical protein